LKVGEDAINGDQHFGNGLRGSEIEAFLMFFDMRRALRRVGNTQLQPRNVLVFRKVSETLHLCSLANETMQSPTRLDGVFLKHSGTFETSEHFWVAHERFSRVAADQLDA
jgi:hypothetical protein